MSFWIESTASACVVHYMAPGFDRPWDWSKDPSDAVVFSTAEVAEVFLRRLGHSGLGLAVRPSWSSLNGA